MNNLTSERMHEIVQQVIEPLSFMFVEPVEHTLLLSPDDPIEVRMVFSGDFCGELALLAPSALARELCANMLGADVCDIIAGDRALDALKELVNVLCGHIVTEIAGEGPAFNLQPPDCGPANLEQWDSVLPCRQAYGFTFDEYPVLIALSVAEPAK